MYTFATTEDIRLQNTLLELILRCFSQRASLIENLQSVNLFSSEDEIQIFHYFSHSIVELRVLIQDSDTFIVAFDKEDKQLKSHISRIQNFRESINHLIIGMVKGTRATKNSKVLFDSSSEEFQLSSDRQSMINNLRIHEIIISFIYKKISIVDKIIESKLPSEYKKEVLLLFKDCYTFLIFYCKSNPTNQKILYQKIDMFIGNMKYEIGQIDLICTVISADHQIYSNNDWILKDVKNNPAVLEKIVNLIEEEGRQVRFLNIFETILDSTSESIMDNLYTVITFLAPKFDNVRGVWKNTKIMYLKPASGGKLEFELDILDTEIVVDRIQWLSEKPEGETTYREEPFVYHSKVVKVKITLSQDTETNNERV